MSSLFEVVAKNRVVKGNSGKKRITGTQGNWYPETLYFLCETQQFSVNIFSSY